MKYARNWCNWKFALRASAAIGAIASSSSFAHAQSATAAHPASTAPEASDAETGGGNGDILVTGTRIAGAETASTSVKIAVDDIKKAGQTDIGEALRSIPFNFNGGQNPGVTPSAGGIANQNVTNGSTPNLRGLGPDATLTLLNGHRISYNGSQQGVDVSSIPLAAVSSIEIVPDGASALYGSDAVAGVVNIILRKDFQGVAFDSTLGGSTEGGGFLQQYSLSTGSVWSSGGFLVAGQFQHQDNVTSDQRSYTAGMPRPADLLPSSRQYGLVVAGHQSLGSTAEFTIDATYNKREGFSRYSPSSPTVRFDARTTDESWSVAPGLNFTFGSGWRTQVVGTYSEDSALQHGGTIPVPSGPATYSDLCQCNKSAGAEASANGAILSIGGGDVAVAFGGGYRWNKYESDYLTSKTVQGGDRESYYAFGELNVPVFSASNARPGFRSLNFSAAGRFEHNSGFGSILTPKLGLIYSPSNGAVLRATWGRSYKAPTLVQQFADNIAYIDPAAARGGQGYPANAVTLESYGGNPNLKAERARTWSVSFDLEPVVLRGFRASISYFNIHYRDRVLQPLLYGTTLSDPSYAQFIDYNPTPDKINEILGTVKDVYNFSGQPFDQANVIAIAHNQYTNVARQNIEGVDFSGSYDFTLAGGTARITGIGSWLRSKQQNSDTAPVTSLAGSIYNSPKFRGRGEASWSNDRAFAGLYVNYIGGVQDNRTALLINGSAMTTVDLSLRYNILGRDSGRRSASVQFSIQNIGNERPPYLEPAATNIAPYDSTNYSAMGRFISVSIHGRW